MRDMYLTNVEWGFRLGIISAEEFKKRNDEAIDRYKPKTWREYLED